jgi:hypothetical protein
LRYNGVHNEAPILVITPGGNRNTAQAKSCLLPRDYTIKSLCKPVYTLSYPLAIWTCRKETVCPR